MDNQGSEASADFRSDGARGHGWHLLVEPQVLGPCMMPVLLIEVDRAGRDVIHFVVAAPPIRVRVRARVRARVRVRVRVRVRGSSAGKSPEALA